MAKHEDDRHDREASALEAPRYSSATVASRLQLPPGPWITVLDALCARFPAISREQWADRFRRGRVLDASGAPLPIDAPYCVGAEIHYFREVPDEPRIEAQAQVLFHDAHLLVADKPHFLPVMPAGAFVTETLLTRLAQQLDNPHLVPLHRIDRETAGLVLFSTNPASRARYHALFHDRGISKHYEAWAPALPSIAFPHRRQSRLLPGEPFFRMREAPGEANSESLIDVIERRDALWRYRLEPVTGRKHQLRLHMAALGAPILHDRCYPELLPQAPDDPARPLQLLARSLCFIDPLSGQRREFSSALALQAAPSAPRGG
ncbi:MAG TPA: pseudouridine synthase [Arenimonas sp.]|nr:pseudouridine synthase [Arenimonas sp.]